MLEGHDPIRIDGDADFTAANGVRSGSGTWDDPYVIEDWDIGGGNITGIMVRNTEAAFTIRNVSIHDISTDYQANAGIYWESVSNGRLESSSITGTYHGFHAWTGSNHTLVRNYLHGNRANGLYLDFPDGALAADNIIFANDEGIVVQNAQSTGVLVTRNNVTDQRVGIGLSNSVGVAVFGNIIANNWQHQGYDDTGNNAWDAGYPIGGNFWSDYSGWDDCSGSAQDVCPYPDGFGDVPYQRIDPNQRSDRYPILPYSPPNEPPIASFGVSGIVYAGQPATLDASSSYDPDGYPIRYAWNFGDGTGTETISSRIDHTYASPGLFSVTLTVTDVRRANSTVVGEVGVEAPPGPPPPDPGPESLVLRAYDHPSAGFRLPIPQGWVVQEDVAFENATIELILLGPVSGGMQTNILVETDEDLTAQETDEYLLAAAQGAIAGVRQDNPSISVDVFDGPTLRRIAAHGAVTFKLQYGTGQYFQSVALVVSEAHRRYWIFILTTDGQSLSVMDEGFGRMLTGFEITREPFTPDQTVTPMTGGAWAWILGGIAVAVLLSVLLAAFALRQPPHAPMAPAPLYSAGPASPPPAIDVPGSGPVVAPQPPVSVPAATVPLATPVRFCPQCGYSVEPQRPFCGHCGSRLPEPPPG